MWFYNNKEFTPEMIGDHVAFVYEIINNETGKKYLGKKKFFFYRTKPPLKGKKRKRKIRFESDWMDYYGSSDALNEDVKRLGPEKFTRKILSLCKTLGEASYLEAKEQFNRDVLLSEDYYNNIIQVRVTERHLAKGKS